MAPEPGSVASHSEIAAALAADPRFERTVKRRSRYAWTLTAVMLIVFFGYILLIAFNKEFLARPLYAGATTSIGIPLGLGVIILGIALTGIYVRRANTEFDAAFSAILEDARK